MHVELQARPSGSSEIRRAAHRWSRRSKLFALGRAELDAVLARIRAAGVPYGDAFDRVGNGQGPGDERDARLPGALSD